MSKNLSEAVTNHELIASHSFQDFSSVLVFFTVELHFIENQYLRRGFIFPFPQLTIT
jgi:hypothetical protein